MTKNYSFNLLLLFLLLFVPLSTYSQNTHSVSGRVLDSDGLPLIGATVTVEGDPTKGAVTNMDGDYKIINISPNAILNFKYISYISEQRKVDGKTDLNVIMMTDTQSLDEVEVVAFATQKKESVVSSISTVKVDQLKVPSSNLTTAFAGQIPGVISYQRSGEPGADNAEFFVRGIASFGFNTGPLILIDNIESTSDDLARLNPQDIESFSIMKDAASTSLYGSRGANGVVYIKTKEGQKGKAKLFLGIETSISTPTSNISLADPITYMRMHNEAILTRDPKEALLYSDDKIDRTDTNNPSVIYPYTDWRKQLMKKSAINTRVTANISGGGEMVRYYVSARYTKDEGLLKVDNQNNFNSNIDLQTYQLRTNVNIDVTKTTELKASLAGVFDDYTGPLYTGTQVYNMVMSANPVLFPAIYPTTDQTRYIKHPLFGNYDQGNYLNPYAQLMKGYKEYSNTNIRASMELNQKLDFITKGLSFMGMINFSRESYYSNSRQYNPFYYGLNNYNYYTGSFDIYNINPTTGTEYLNFLPGARTVENSMLVETRTNYTREFGKHAVSGLFVTQYIDKKNPNGIKSIMTLETTLPSRNMTYSGRATYGYDSRYFVEGNFGYNGSERFDKSHRWGFFPSFGGGWMVSNESFFEPLRKTVSKLKLRGSYGLVGNDKIGALDQRFLYLSNVNLNGSSVGFGLNNGYTNNTVSINRYANAAIGWEKAYKTNLAMEISLKGFELIAEYFTEKRTNILQTRSGIPSMLGYTSSIQANLGEAKSQGIDFEFKYNKKITNDLTIMARGTFTYAKNKYIKYEDDVYKNEWWKSRVGYPIKQNWGYIAEGLFIDDAEVSNSPTQFGNYGAGDIKYKDVNGDGVINELDMVPIGYPTSPEINYGFGSSVIYKHFELNFQFQGSARSSFWIDYNKVSPFFNTSGTFGIDGVSYGYNQLTQFIADSYWSESNRDRYAVWPRLSKNSVENNAKPSTWFMRDGSFLRLKLLELAYNVPTAKLQSLGVKNLRVYGSATNVFILSKFSIWDAELAGNGLGYPLQRVYNLGINITF